MQALQPRCPSVGVEFQIPDPTLRLSAGCIRSRYREMSLRKASKSCLFVKFHKGVELFVLEIAIFFSTLYMKLALSALFCLRPDRFSFFLLWL